MQSRRSPVSVAVALRTLVALALTSVVAACAGGSTATSSTTITTGASVTAPPSMGTMRAILIAALDRPSPPGPAASPDSPQATVPASVTESWTATGWGPEGTDDPPPVPDGFTPVLVWVQFPTTGWEVDVVDAGLVDGTLVLAAERTAPGANCVTAQALTGVSYLLGVNVDGEITPDTPVELRFIERTRDC